MPGSREIRERETRERLSMGLSPREYQIFSLRLAGFPMKKIAEDLGLAPHTVGNHILSYRSKLHIYGHEAELRYALRVKSRPTQRASNAF